MAAEKDSGGPKRGQTAVAESPCYIVMGFGFDVQKTGNLPRFQTGSRGEGESDQLRKQ